MNAFKKRQEDVLIKKIEECGKCNFCHSVLKLSKPKLKDLYDAMVDKDITNPIIRDVLGDWKILASQTVIQNHRMGSRGCASHMEQLKKAVGYE